MRGELELFQPRPDTLYSLEATVELTGATRRGILIYYREGLVQPVFLPPYGMMGFDAKAIRAIRRIEYLRGEHGINLAGARMIIELTEQLERLRAELEFWRQA
jgi:MerR family transcriptional regulator/heat shock protein HspR